MEKSDLDTFNVDELCNGLNGKTREEAAKAMFKVAEGFARMRHEDNLTYSQKIRCEEIEEQIKQAYLNIGDIKVGGWKIYKYNPNIP